MNTVASPSPPVIEWLRRKVKMLERRLEMYKLLLAALEGSADVREEVIEEVRIGRKVAKIMRGSDYVRVVFNEPLEVADVLRSYLLTVESKLRALQANDRDEYARLAALEAKYIREMEEMLDAQEEEQVRLQINSDTNGVVEIRYEPLRSTLEFMIARTALKHVAAAAARRRV